jgi:ATP-dependent protease ClpP protease subunit
MRNKSDEKPKRISKAARLALEEQEKVRKALLGEHFPEDVHSYRVDRHNFIIYIGGDPSASIEEGTEPGVEFNMADRFERNLDMLSNINSERPILVSMASCGGYWDEGMQMFSAILTCPNPVTVLGTKWCRSMTSVIPLAADRFVIRPLAQYMFHQGTYGFYGTEQEASTEDSQRRIGIERMYRIYVARLKMQGAYKDMSEQRIYDMLMGQTKDHVDVWLSADEARRWGFVDDLFLGNWKTLRATKVNEERRKTMFSVLREKLRVEWKIYPPLKSE